jgi:pimeloyl-ACP methyl ester carboxylesterase
VIGGCSMGGYLAMAVLRAAPERVAGLVLVDTKPTPDDDTARQTRLDMAERVLTDGTGFLADESLPRLLAPIATAEVVGRVRSLIDAQPATGVAWAQRAMAARPDSSALLTDADVPTLIVHGALDALMPVEIAHTTASLMSNVVTAVIADAGHLPPLETPAAFTTALIAWLAGVSV